ncbi:MAG: sugar ABC transporter ATP-binding protein [Spirochaetaceae bacterium]|jgi:ribose transport system ATP-binding protein/inositol transport system ATP-binding protein|nr:sugar ABC transporter ATP-binding protein [Spirochaetaceae bacterium]
MKNDLILECRGISKAFGGTQALDNVELKIGRGEVHALMGENGAGKSTLMKCVIGLHKQDSGEIFFEGKPYAVHGPAEAICAGISMIHQELNPEPHLTIAESIFLGREDTYRGTPILNKKETERRAAEILRSFNFNMKASTLMEELTLAQVQMIEIIRAVSCSARLIIMDEPTSSLDSEETARLFATIRGLKEKGASIIYISHRMEEIFEICDTVSIFRDGRYIDSCAIEKVTKDELISKMVGRAVENVFPKVDCPIGDPVLRVEGISGKGFSNVSFEVRAGEILGFSGLVGSGRSETVRGIFGLDKLSGGKIYLDGKETVIKNPANAIEKGICMVNEDRKLFGLCLQRSLRENISLPNLPQKQKGVLINQKREINETCDVAKTLTVKAASIESEAYSLSGGNQQKVVIAKWVMAAPRVLILDEPTRGVDVGAKSEIHALMCRFAAEGLAVIMISSELPEVMGMSDRILVFHEGKTNGVVLRKDILSGKETQKTILAREFGQTVEGR